MRTTHTYAVLKVSPRTFKEIASSLSDYKQQFHEDEDGTLIDMGGIAIQAEAQEDELLNACKDMRRMLRASGVPDENLAFFDSIIANSDK